MKVKNENPEGENVESVTTTETTEVVVEAPNKHALLPDDLNPVSQADIDAEPNIKHKQMLEKERAEKEVIGGEERAEREGLGKKQQAREEEGPKEP